MILPLLVSLKMYSLGKMFLRGRSRVSLMILQIKRAHLCLPRIPSLSTNILVARQSQISWMHFPCWQAHRRLTAGSLCLVQSSSASRCRKFLSRKNPVLLSKSLVA